MCFKSRLEFLGHFLLRATVPEVFTQFHVAELCLMMLGLKIFGRSYFLKIKVCPEIKAVFMKCPFKMKMNSC